MSAPIPRVKGIRQDRLKRCAGACQQWHPLWCFGHDRTRADGRRSVCRPCRALRQAQLSKPEEPRYRPWQRIRAQKATRELLEQDGAE